MNVDRNVLQIIYRYIHKSITRDLLVEYHSRVRLDRHDCDMFNHNICIYFICFNKREYNYRILSSTDMQRYIFNLNGSPIFYNQRYLKVPINY